MDIYEEVDAEIKIQRKQMLLGWYIPTSRRWEGTWGSFHRKEQKSAMQEKTLTQQTNWWPL